VLSFAYQEYHSHFSKQNIKVSCKICIWTILILPLSIEIIWLAEVCMVVIWELEFVFYMWHLCGWPIKNQFFEFFIFLDMFCDYLFHVLCIKLLMCTIYTLP
jgi:hypothetical protein